MLGIADYWAFVAAVLVFLMLPGAGIFAPVNSTGQRSFRAAEAATFGPVAGDQVPMWLAAPGVAAVLQANPTPFKLLQYAGAAHVGWIGVRLAVARPGGTQPVAIRAERDFRRAFLITLLTFACCLLLAAFARAVAARVRAHRKAAQWLERSAGVFLVGFGIERAQ